MTTEQPENDPFRKHGGQEPPSAPPPPPGGGGGPSGGGPYGAGSPYGVPGAGDPYGNAPHGDGPFGAADPLAGMPPLASRGRRLVARIVDALIIGIPVGLVVGLAQRDVQPADPGNTFAQSLIYVLVYFVYEGLMLTTSGQTVGKRLMGVRVAMLANGAVPQGSPGWFRAAVYSLPTLVPCLGFVFWLVNVLFCTWDKPYQQCLHDKAAKTVVVAVEEQDRRDKQKREPDQT